MSQEDQDKQFISDLQKYTELQASLASVQATLTDIGRNLKGTGESVERDPYNCSTEWGIFKSQTSQIEGLVKQFKEESNESQRLAESLRKRRFTFPPNK
ncbi:MAG TPA: hypothetical protein VMV34_10190 [Terriglobia bacterium]|nr:hypothetical protein [Terriglobia bacterium]